jgi:hypothetical protein
MTEDYKLSTHSLSEEKTSDDSGAADTIRNWSSPPTKFPASLAFERNMTHTKRLEGKEKEQGRKDLWDMQGGRQQQDKQSLPVNYRKLDSRICSGIWDVTKTECLVIRGVQQLVAKKGIESGAVYFNRTELLEACGFKKKLSKRKKMEYNGIEVMRVGQALTALCRKAHYFEYTALFSKGKFKGRRVTHRAYGYIIYESGWADFEDKKRCFIKPHPMMLDMSGMVLKDHLLRSSKLKDLFRISEIF